MPAPTNLKVLTPENYIGVMFSIPTALGVTEHLFFRAENYGELDDAFVAAAEHQDRMVLIEAVVPRLDIPDLLTNLVADLG